MFYRDVPMSSKQDSIYVICACYWSRYVCMKCFYYNTCIDKAVLMDRTLNKKGKSVEAYPSGTCPTAFGADSKYSDKRISSFETIFEGPEGCVPIHNSA